MGPTMNNVNVHNARDTHQLDHEMLRCRNFRLNHSPYSHSAGADKRSPEYVQFELTIHSLQFGSAN